MPRKVLFSSSNPQTQNTGNDGVEDEMFIGHQLRTVKRWHRIQKQICRGAEIPDRELVQAFVSLRGTTETLDARIFNSVLQFPNEPLTRREKVVQNSKNR